MSTTSTAIAFATLLIGGTAALTGTLGYATWQGASDANFALKTSAKLNQAITHAVYGASLAATDRTQIQSLVKAMDSAEEYSGALKTGPSGAGLKDRDLNLALSNVDELWRQIQPHLERLASGAGEGSGQGVIDDALQQMSGVVSVSEQARKVLEGLNASEEAKRAVLAAQQSMRESLALAQRNRSNPAPALRAAETSLSEFISVINAHGAALPRDPALMNSLSRAFRSAQTSQRALVKASEWAVSSPEQISAAREIWSFRERMDQALGQLDRMASNMNQNTSLNSIHTALAAALWLLLSLASLFVINGIIGSRARQSESEGQSMMSIAQKRSKDISLLTQELMKIGEGNLNAKVTEGQEFTKEIAQTLNSVLESIKLILNETTLTISSLTEACEESYQTSLTVDENAREQSKAVQHVLELLTQVVSFVHVIEKVVGTTREVSSEVIKQVDQGDESVAAVGVGINEVSQHLNNINMALKHLIEHVQSMESLTTVVNDVAKKATMVSFNSRLQAANEADSKIAQAMHNNAEAMEKLAHECSAASHQFDQSLRSMAEAAKETQQAVDGSRLEIEKVRSKSTSAKAVLKDITELARRLGAVVEEVTSGTEELSSITTEAAETMNQISTYAKQNESAINSTNAAIRKIGDRASEVGRKINLLMPHNE